MSVKAEQLEQLFVYHPPVQDQLDHYDAIRNAGRLLADAILANTPVCGDQQAAIRKVREAVMTANGAIALNGLV
jgi:hypothetical protein